MRLRRSALLRLSPFWIGFVVAVAIGSVGMRFHDTFLAGWGVGLIVAGVIVWWKDF